MTWATMKRASLTTNQRAHSLVQDQAPSGRGAKSELYAAWQGTSQNLAAIAGGNLGVLLTALLGEARLDAWGWRVAFAIGALILPVGLLLRRDPPETLHRPEPGAMADLRLDGGAP